ncbi:hypothetical protein LR48_Vigan627s002200 [Vigna angularis]|uniref:PB1-like domain-containing protein n=1 Tax=Phaseolus angularis TaxID=3914 RepID=A0A0L9TEJ6_PHAAN|nr:hypothetical protein LR48_Vigan627s002200 [Vigna angularis]
MYELVFEVVFYNGEKFVNNGSLKYVGETNILSGDPGRLGYFENLSILKEISYFNAKEMDYVNVKEMWYLVSGGFMLEGRLKFLFDDKCACRMVNIVTLNCYVVHIVSKPQIINNLEYFPHEGDGNKGSCMDEVRGEDECEHEVDVEGEGEGEDEVHVNAEGEDEVHVKGEDEIEFDVEGRRRVMVRVRMTLI